MTSTEKLEVARALARLGVDVIEAGFPAASPDDLAAVRAIAEGIGTRPIEGRPSSDPPIICGLARASRGDIDRAWEAVKRRDVPAHPHLPGDVRAPHAAQAAHVARRRARPRERDGRLREGPTATTWSSAPRTRGAARPPFLYEVLARAIRAGATTLNIPDTVGLHDPRRVRSAHPRHPRERARRRRRHPLGALPRRPGARDGEHARRASSRARARPR